MYIIQRLHELTDKEFALVIDMYPKAAASEMDFQDEMYIFTVSPDYELLILWPRTGKLSSYGIRSLYYWRNLRGDQREIKTYGKISYLHYERTQYVYNR